MKERLKKEGKGKKRHTLGRGDDDGTAFRDVWHRRAGKEEGSKYVCAHCALKLLGRDVCDALLVVLHLSTGRMKVDVAEERKEGGGGGATCREGDGASEYSPSHWRY